MQTFGEIIVREDYILKLALSERECISVRYGQNVINAKLKVTKNSTKVYSLSTKLRNQLGISNRKQLSIHYNERNDYLHIGPTIGILVKSIPAKEGLSSTSTNSELIFLGQVSLSLNAQVFLFRPIDVDWSNNAIKGYAYIGGVNKWTASVYPIPDVVYDRVTSRRSESQYQIKELKNRLCEFENLRYFNPGFLDKLDVHNLLSNNEALRTYLPETYELNEYNLEYMLNKYPILYLKPSAGSLGMGIIIVKRNEAGGLKYSIRSNGKINKSAESIAVFLKKTQVYRGSKIYLVQQGLNFAKYKGSAFDIRIIFQKDGKGEWLIGKKFVRVAPTGSSITNLSRGGHVELSQKVLKTIFPARKEMKATQDKLYKLCLEIANSIEDSTRGNFGELGFDIGVDKNGDLWLIEVNSKPRKTTDSEYSRTIMKETFRRPLEYAIFLAGFASKNNINII